MRREYRDRHPPRPLRRKALRAIREFLADAYPEYTDCRVIMAPDGDRGAAAPEKVGWWFEIVSMEEEEDEDNGLRREHERPNGYVHNDLSIEGLYA